MAHPVNFRRYRIADYDAVAALWTRINRELAPAGMEQLFEQYIATTIDGELKQLHEVFSEARRNAFWVVEGADEIVGCFGIESHGADDTELRRMYLDKAYRGAGTAQRMLDHAQAEARALGFKKMILSTAEIQRSALAFYRKSGFRQIRTQTAETMNSKQVGGGLTRFHFEKVL
jgi:N-acetylglutamate synthase-like GNAT family acetyltransferase